MLMSIMSMAKNPTSSVNRKVLSTTAKIPIMQLLAETHLLLNLEHENAYKKTIAQIN
jgi:hypothetical protein